MGTFLLLVLSTTSATLGLDNSNAIVASVLPSTFTMVQGDASAEFSWDELRDVKFLTTVRLFQRSSGTPVLIQVEGSGILISDI